MCLFSDKRLIVSFCFPNMHLATDFHREIVSEMGELGVLGPTIKGKQTQSLIISQKEYKRGLWFRKYIVTFGLYAGFSHCIQLPLQGTAVQALATWHTAWLPERLREWTAGIGQSWVSSLRWSCIPSTLTAQMPRRRSTCPALVRWVFFLYSHTAFEKWQQPVLSFPCVFYLSCSQWRNLGLLRPDRAQPRQRSQRHGDQGQIQPIKWHIQHQWSQDLVGRTTAGTDFWFEVFF